jgi:ankyrin repeat protein
MAQLLIDHGANVSSKDFGLSTPLHEAAISVNIIKYTHCIESK